MFTRPSHLLSLALTLLFLLLTVTTPTAALPAARPATVAAQPVTPSTPSTPPTNALSAAAAPESLAALPELLPEALSASGGLPLGLGGAAHGSSGSGSPLSLLGRVVVVAAARTPAMAAVHERAAAGEALLQRMERFQLRLARAAAL